ncbi:MAG: hypothetical protein GY859_30180, partial [Desulfobacterales bacterium]|nr:hypothetical protein [Desulfobacterales bacterium]
EGAVITNNTIDSNRGHGIYMNGAKRCEISNNYIRQGVYWFSNNITIKDNIIQGSVDGAIRGVGSNVVIQRNVISDNWSRVINIWEGSGVVIEGNRVSGAGEGIPAISTGCENAAIKNNTLEDCHTGISSGQGQQVTGNALSNCSIGLEIGWNDCRVEGNDIADCDIGLRLSGAGHTVAGNT